MQTNNIGHIPVMKKEVINFFNMVEGGTYVDATFGLGSHSIEIGKRIGKHGIVIGLDKDAISLERFGKRENIYPFHADFKYMKNICNALGIMYLDGILMDLGISSFQLNSPGRGFSYLKDERIDMRMNQNYQKDALYILNNAKEHELMRIFKENGEILQAKNLAKAIVINRAKKIVKHTSDLKQIALSVYRAKKNSFQFLSQVFQAIRIEVNQELESIKMALLQANKLLKKGGRILIISYHSLEDRLVKYFFQTGNFNGEMLKNHKGEIIRPLQQIGKVLKPSLQEIAMNPRSRSAKLRIAEKL